jgi:hypothetical protein
MRASRAIIAYNHRKLKIQVVHQMLLKGRINIEQRAIWKWQLVCQIIKTRQKDIALGLIYVTRALKKLSKFAAFQTFVSHSQRHDQTRLRAVKRLVALYGRTGMRESLQNFWGCLVESRITSNNILWQWKLAREESRYFTKLRKASRMMEAANDISQVLQSILAAHKSKLFRQAALWSRQAVALKMLTRLVRSSKNRLLRSWQVKALRSGASKQKPYR